MFAAVMAVTQMCKQCGRVFGSYLCDNPLYFFFLDSSYINKLYFPNPSVISDEQLLCIPEIKSFALLTTVN